MIIHLLFITSLNDYIISPQTWLHYIKHKYKLFFILFYLCFSYYYKSVYCIVGIVCCFIVAVTINVPLEKIISKFYLLLYYSVFFFNLIVQTNCTKIFLKSKITDQIYIREKLGLSDIKDKTCLFVLPEIIIKLACIPLNSYLYLKILFSTTKYEDIILYIFEKVNKAISIGQQTTFIMTVSTQLFLIVTQKIFQMMLSIQLRSMNRICALEYINIFYLIFIELLVFSRIYIDKVSYTLYIRKISYTNFVLTKY